MISAFKLALLSVPTIGATVVVPLSSWTKGSSVQSSETAREVENSIAKGDSELTSLEEKDDEVDFIPRDVSSELVFSANKLKERYENPDLCREILRSKTNIDSWIRACRLSTGSSQIEFAYYYSKYSMPIAVESLKFTHKELVIKLREKDDLDSNSIRLDLTPELINLQGVFTYVAGGKEFNEKQCQIEEQTYGIKEWRVSCKEI